MSSGRASTRISQCPIPNLPNFLDFHTFADGREVEAQYEQKAFADGVEISDWLKSLGVPLAPQSDATWKALDAPCRADQDKLIKQNIATPDDYDVGKGMGTSCRAQLDAQVVVLLAPDFPRWPGDHGRAPLYPERRRDDGHAAQIDPIDPADLSEYEIPIASTNRFLAAVRAALGKRLDATACRQRPLVREADRLRV